MTLSEVSAGVQIITLDTYKGNFALTALNSGWRAETVPIVSSLGVALSSIIRLRANDVNSNVVDLCEMGIHPAVEASDFWNLGSLSVLADRDNILAFYPWLVKEGFTRAASEIETTFFEFFVDLDTFWGQLMQN